MKRSLLLSALSFLFIMKTETQYFCPQIHPSRIIYTFKISYSDS